MYDARPLLSICAIRKLSCCKLVMVANVFFVVGV